MGDILLSFHRSRWSTLMGQEGSMEHIPSHLGSYQLKDMKERSEGFDALTLFYFGDLYIP